MSADGYVNGNGPHTFDTTGQVQPPGMRPRLTTSLSEEEGSLCFQVDVNGICVARREGLRPLSVFHLVCPFRLLRGWIMFHWFGIYSLEVHQLMAMLE